MKKLLFVFLLISQFAFAEDRVSPGYEGDLGSGSGGPIELDPAPLPINKLIMSDYIEYTFYIDKPTKVTLTKVIETNDACNSFSLNGLMRSLPPRSKSHGGFRYNQEFLYDAEVYKTQTGCAPGPLRRVVLTDNFDLIIKAASQFESVRLLVPEGFEVELK